MLGRWLLYCTVGILLLLALLSGGEAIGSDNPKGSWRSILLSIGGTLVTLAGFGPYLAHGGGGSLGTLWPVASILMWLVAGSLAVGAWFSIAADLRRERGR